MVESTALFCCECSSFATPVCLCGNLASSEATFHDSNIIVAFTDDITNVRLIKYIEDSTGFLEAILEDIPLKDAPISEIGDLQ